MFVGARLHVTGGVLRGGRSIEGEGAIAGMYLVFCFFLLYLHFVYIPVCIAMTPDQKVIGTGSMIITLMEVSLS